MFFRGAEVRKWLNSSQSRKPFLPGYHLHMERVTFHLLHLCTKGMKEKCNAEFFRKPGLTTILHLTVRQSYAYQFCVHTTVFDRWGEQQRFQVPKGWVPYTCQLLTFPTMKLKNKTKKQSVNLELMKLSFLLEYFPTLRMSFPYISVDLTNPLVCHQTVQSQHFLFVSVTSSFAILAEIALQVE